MTGLQTVIERIKLAIEQILDVRYVRRDLQTIVSFLSRGRSVSDCIGHTCSSVLNRHRRQESIYQTL